MVCTGRTGRAGKTGVCVTLVGRNKEGLIPFIEKKAGVKFERTGAPQPADMAKVAGEPTLYATMCVSKLLHHTHHVWCKCCGSLMLFVTQLHCTYHV